MCLFSWPKTSSSHDTSRTGNLQGSSKQPPTTGSTRTWQPLLRACHHHHKTLVRVVNKPPSSLKAQSKCIFDKIQASDYTRLVFCALLKKLKAKITQCFGLWPKTQGFFLKKLKVMRPNPKPGGIEF